MEVYGRVDYCEIELGRYAESKACEGKFGLDDLAIVEGSKL